MNELPSKILKPIYLGILVFCKIKRDIFSLNHCHAKAQFVASLSTSAGTIPVSLAAPFSVLFDARFNPKKKFLNTVGRGSLLAAYTMQDIGDKLLIKPREEVIFFLYRNLFWPTRLV